jgi:hypothetical protein
VASLLDIGPLFEDIPVGTKHVRAFGISPEGFFHILTKFPQLWGMFSSGDQRQINVVALQAAAPGSVAMAIAISTTNRASYDTAEAWHADVDRAYAKALQLSAHYQMRLFQAALRLTFPEGIGPFIKGLESLSRSINQVAQGTVPDMTSSKRSRSGFTSDSRGLRLGKGPRSESSARSAKRK